MLLNTQQVSDHERSVLWTRSNLAHIFAQQKKCEWDCQTQRKYPTHHKKLPYFEVRVDQFFGEDYIKFDQNLLKFAEHVNKI